MKISTKGRYMLRMLVDLGERQDDGFIALKDIAKRQNISKKYLEQIVPILNGANVLKANRGPQGGYKLAKTPDQYTIGEILRLTEGSLSPIACVERDPADCRRRGECAVYPVWQGLYRVIQEYLDGITLQDVLDGCVNDYVI